MLPLLPAGVLLLVALSQVVVASNTHLTPWRGGGFGMFSTLDNHDQRFLRVTATTAAGDELPIDVHSLLEAGPLAEGALVHARARPTQHTLAAAVDAIANYDLAIKEGVALVSENREVAGLPRPNGEVLEDIALINVKVYRVWFDRGNSVLLPELLMEYESSP